MIYKKLIRPVLFRCDEEDAHNLAKSVLTFAEPVLPALAPLLTHNSPDLECDLFGVPLRNPVGVAAGLDKTGSHISQFGHLGFGFAEIGSITARECQGNARPRMFRLPKDEAVVNYMGLNSPGASEVVVKLHQKLWSCPLGVNIAKSNYPNIKGDAAIGDILQAYDKVTKPQLMSGLRYVTINISCPNTHDGVETEIVFVKDLFKEINKRLQKRPTNVLVKLSSDSPYVFIESVVHYATAFGFKGFVCGNTTAKRDMPLMTKGALIEMPGGLSGKPLLERNLELTKTVASLRSPGQIIIGVGGISSGLDAYRYLKAGANLVQIYTALVYEGPFVVKRICKELAQLMSASKVNVKVGCP